MTDEIWSKLSLKVSNDPETLSNWEELVEHASKTTSKSSPKKQLDLFRTTYQQFLMKYPFLEQYWVNYAMKEYHLGNTEECKLIFNEALSMIPFSNLIWINYLKLLNEIESDYESLIEYYQIAELKIGFHYHSFEFWRMFLKVELEFNGKTIYYYNLLRKIIEIPIFNYSYFFKIMFKEIEDLNEEMIPKLIDKEDLIKKFKITNDDKFIKLKESEIHDIKGRLKKLITEVYITTQFKTFEIYQYEKNVSIEYYIPGLLKSYQELENFNQYIEFMKLNGSNNQVEQLYQRFLIPLSNYPEVWLNFADFFINLGNLQDSLNILYKSILFLSKFDLIKIYLKLIKIELSLNNYLKVKDLLNLVLSIDNLNDNLELLIQLLNIEYILNYSYDSNQFISFFEEIIRDKPIEISLALLSHLINFKTLNISIEYIQSLNKDEIFTHNVKYWLIILNISLKTSSDISKTKEYYNLALTSVGNDNKTLLNWGEKYLWYDLNKEDLNLEFKRNSALVFST